MADFYPVLSRAIASLQGKGPEARRAVYEKAKTVLVAQLRGVEPPVSEAEIARQRLALDEVIARIEREQAGADSIGQPDVREFEPGFEPPAASQPPAQPPASAAPPPAADASPRTPPAPSSSPTPQPARPVATADDAAEGPSEPAAFDRPRVEIARPRQKRQLPWRNLAVGGVIAAVVGCVALAAVYLNRETPAPLQPAASQQAPQAQASGPKINERVGAEAAPQAPASPPGAAPQPPQASGLAVAQRAVLYIEPTDGSQQPRAVNGRVAWRVEAQNAGRGQPLETIVRADVEIPDGGLSLAFTIRRNNDQAFPASHIVGLRFQRSGDDGNGAVKEAGVPQFKSEENERGAPLSAITSALGDNLFVSAMSRVPVEVERNLDLIRSRNWIDIPIRFASGRRGIVAFEKGVSGDQRIAEGIRAWQ